MEGMYGDAHGHGYQRSCVRVGMMMDFWGRHCHGRNLMIVGKPAKEFCFVLCFWVCVKGGLEALRGVGLARSSCPRREGFVSSLGTCWLVLLSRQPFKR